MLFWADMHTKSDWIVTHNAIKLILPTNRSLQHTIFDSILYMERLRELNIKTSAAAETMSDLGAWNKITLMTRLLSRDIIKSNFYHI